MSTCSACPARSVVPDARPAAAEHLARPPPTRPSARCTPGRPATPLHPVRVCPATSARRRSRALRHTLNQESNVSTTSPARTLAASPVPGPAHRANPPGAASEPTTERATHRGVEKATALTVVPRRNRWTWLGVAVVIVLVAMFVNGLATNPGWDWPTFGRYFATETIIRALGTTIQLTVLGTVAGFALGVVLAAMRL